MTAFFQQQFNKLFFVLDFHCYFYGFPFARQTNKQTRISRIKITTFYRTIIHSTINLVVVVAVVVAFVVIIFVAPVSTVVTAVIVLFTFFCCCSGCCCADDVVAVVVATAVAVVTFVAFSCSF